MKPTRLSNRRGAAAAALGAVVALILAACGGDDGEQEGDAGGGDPGGSEASGGDIIVGTTDEATAIDPAACYSYSCSRIIRNLSNTLMTYQPGEATPSPGLAAEPPEISEDGLTYTFTLREGVKFHDGSDLTSEDVKFSFERAMWINHPDGASFLLGGIETIETPDPLTVEITLAEEDSTFTAKLIYVVAAIVPSDGPYEMPDEPLDDEVPQETKDSFLYDQDFVGTGPYTLEEFRPGEAVQLVKFDDYFGEPARNERVLVQSFAEPAQLQSALESGEIDVIFRHVTPEQRQALQENPDIKTVEGKGASIRYMVFNISDNHPVISNVDVRKAIAAAIDRDRIIENVLAGGAEPLYSMVPPLFEQAHVPAFEEMYSGTEPGDFISEPVAIDLWHESSGHYGETETALAQEIARMLEETGMFTVNVQNAEWAQFSDNNAPAATSPYPVYLLGWYPDFLDPDNYIQPFYFSEGYLRNYNNPEMDSLIAEEQAANDPASPERIQTFKDIQQLAAEDASIVPLYVVTPFAFAKQSITGLDETMDASQIFRLYLLSNEG